MTAEVDVPVEIVRGAGFPTTPSAEEAHDRALQTHPAFVLPRQLLLAQDRAAWLGERLRAQVEREGVHGVVGAAFAITLDGTRVKVGEYARVLAEQERAERAHVAALAERVARLGLDQRALQVDAGGWLAASLQALVRELGFSLDDKLVSHAARRSALAGRRAMGKDDGDPDMLIGPRLSAEQRVAMLRAALAVAERDAEAMRAASGQPAIPTGRRPVG